MWPVTYGDRGCGDGRARHVHPGDHTHPPTGHLARFAAFGTIGGSVFWVGIGLQLLLTGGELNDLRRR